MESPQVSCPTNHPTELDYSHTFFNFPSTPPFPAIHTVNITFLNLFNPKIYSNNRRVTNNVFTPSQKQTLLLSTRHYRH